MVLTTRRTAVDPARRTHEPDATGNAR
jgi:hypothetical protein